MFLDGCNVKTVGLGSALHCSLVAIMLYFVHQFVAFLITVMDWHCGLDALESRLRLCYSRCEGLADNVMSFQRLQLFRQSLASLASNVLLSKVCIG